MRPFNLEQLANQIASLEGAVITLWIGLAVLWSSVSHWVLGVPHDMIIRARRDKIGPAMDDLHDLVRVNVNRILYISEVSGAWMLLFGSAFFTILGMTAFVYDVEFSQALFFLVAPLGALAMMSFWTARKIRRDGDKELVLIKRLLRHRFATQMVGVFSIFVTAMFGMYQNLYVGPLGF